MKKYEWILFDADNTLLDFDLAQRRSLRQTIEEADIAYQEVHQQIYQRINKQCWEDYEKGKISQTELRDKRFRLFFSTIGSPKSPHRANQNYLKKLADSDDMVEGAQQLLDLLLEAGFRLALITNGLKEVQRPRVSKAKLNDYFEAIVISDEIGVAKPHSGFFQHTFRSISNPVKSSVLVVGDSLGSDIKGGNDFGLSTCWYNYLGIENQSAIHSKYTIRRLEELPQIVWKL